MNTTTTTTLLLPLLLLLLTTPTKAKDEVEGGLFLYIVIGQGAAVFQLFPRKNQPLLIGRDAFLVLNLLLHILNRVRGLDIQCDRFSCKGLYKNLHAYGTSDTDDERLYTMLFFFFIFLFFLESTNQGGTPRSWKSIYN